MKNILLSFLIFGLISITATQAENLWQPLGGPFGGSLSDILKDTEGNLVARTYSNVYRSTNDGQSWSFQPVQGFNIYKLFAVDKNIFVALSQFDDVQQNKLYISNNNMDTWEQVTTGIEGQSIYNVVKLKDGALYACCKTAVFKSTDKGENWIKAFDVSPENVPYVVNLVQDSVGNLFAGTYLGLYMSTNEGSSWARVDLGTPTTFSGIELMLVNSEGTIYVTTPMDAFKSVDNGVHWTSLGDSLPHSNKLFLKSPGNHIMFAGSYSGIYKSTNDGDSWSQVYTKAALAIVENGENEFLMATSNGALYTDDQFKTIKYKNNGIAEISVSNLFLDPTTSGANTLIIIGDGAGSMQRSTDNGVTWGDNFVTGGAGITSIIGTSQGNIFATSVWGGVIMSSDKGKTWKAKMTGLSDPDIRSIVVDNAGNLYNGSFSIISKSSDNGTTWNTILAQSQSVQCNTLAVNSNDVLFAGTSVYGALKTTDRGANWTQINNGINQPINQLAIDKSDNIFAITESGDLYKSTNNGDNWTAVATGKSIQRIFLLEKAGMFAGILQDNTVQLYRSMDMGANWTLYNNGMGAGNSILSLAQGADDYLYAGTVIGVYKSINPVTTGVDEDKESEADFKVFPNPVAQNLSVNCNENTHYTVYNSIGELVLKGDYSGSINASALESGLYYIQINGKMLKFIKL